LTERRTSGFRVDKAAYSLPVNGSWTVKFPGGWGAPRSITLDKLNSWSDHSNSGVKYFSGTAEYVTELNVPSTVTGRNKVVMLDLGKVKNFAEVRLNGRDLGTLWKAPFQIDVSETLRPGKNTLSIKVTNLWPNRLIGDEQLPAEVEWKDGHIKEWPKWLLEG